MFWFRRGWLLRAHAACFALFYAFVAVATCLAYLGHGLSDLFVEVGGGIILTAWLALFWLGWFWWEKRDRGRAGTLVLDGPRIAVMRGTGLANRHAIESFECGWMIGRSETAIELQKPNGNLLVACPENAETAKQWLAATGLDSPSRTLTMRLDDGEASWLWQTFLITLSILSLCGIALWLLPRLQQLPPLVLDVGFSAATLGGGFAYARDNALARVVVNASGVRIRRLARPTRLLPWISVAAIEEDDQGMGARYLVLALTDGTSVRLRCSLELHRNEALMERIRRGIASSPHAPTVSTETHA